MTATSAPARGGVRSPAGGAVRGARRRWRLPFSPWHLVLIPATIVLIFPFVWLVITSVQTPAEALHFPPVLIPHQIRLANYPDALNSAPFGRFFVNSAIVAVVTVLSNLVLCSLAGYAFARFRFLGRTALFAVIMATLMVPFQVTMIPQFIITKWLGVHVLAAVGINHLGALILPNAATAFGIFFLRQFFRTLPLEYEESARVDGAGAWHRTLRIVVPLLRPTIVNLVILDFIGKMKQFALVWVMTRGGPMWGTETVATYVVKRAFEWKTLDLGYPSAIAVIWFVIIFGLSLLLTRVLQRREALEF